MHILLGSARKMYRKTDTTFFPINIAFPFAIHHDTGQQAFYLRDQDEQKYSSHSRAVSGCSPRMEVLRLQLRARKMLCKVCILSAARNSVPNGNTKTPTQIS